jgi:hypothetical protein
MRNRQTIEALESLFKKATQVREAWRSLMGCGDQTFETQQKFWKDYETKVREFRKYYEDFARQRLLEEDLNAEKLVSAIVESGLLNPLAIIRLFKTLEAYCYFEPIFEPFRGMST